MKLYRKFEIPEHWNYRRAEYTAPILAVADPGYIITWVSVETLDFLFVI